MFQSKTGGDEEDDDASYQLEMMRCLREVNVDNNTVGWYQSTYLGSYQTLEMVETFASYQESIKCCVCIAYDPQAAAQGSFGLRAMKLKDKFLKLFREGQISASTLNQEGITARDIFQDLPITITNSSLVSAMFTRLQPDVGDQGDFDRLSFVEPHLLERNLEFMMGSMDDYQSKIYEVSQFHRMSQRHEVQHQQWLQKRKVENAQRMAAGEEPLGDEDPNYSGPLPEPSRLESYLIGNQAAQFGERINVAGGQTLQKLCLMNALYANSS